MSDVEQSADWPFAKHLRFVHFVLVSVTSVVLVASTVESSGPARAAYIDLLRIKDLVENRLASPQWLHHHIEEAIAREHPGWRDLESAVLLSPESAGDAVARDVSIYDEHAFFFVRSSAIARDWREPERTLTRAAEREVEPFSGDVRNRSYELLEQSQTLSRLSDFKRLWDLLYRKSVTAITEVSDLALVVHANGAEIPFDLRLMDSLDELDRRVRFSSMRDRAFARWVVRKAIDAASWKTIEPLMDHPESWLVDFGYRFVQQGWRHFDAIAPPPSTVETLEGYKLVRMQRYRCQDNWGRVCMAIFVPLVMHSIEFTGQEHLIRLANSFTPTTLWRKGAFRHVFPELHAATANTANLPMDDLLVELRDEIELGGSRLNAFGLNVPSSAIAFWGPLAIALTLLYFLVHLRQFTAVPRDAVARVFPWIGLYGTLLPRTVLFASVVVFPAGVAVYVGWPDAPSFIEYKVPVWEQALPLWRSGLTLVIVALSLASAHELRKLRRLIASDGPR